jgi:hypothetical protein
MIKTKLLCLSLSVCSIGSIQSSHASVYAASARAYGVSSLLAQSISRMKTLSTVHGEGYLQGGSTSLRISADCVGQVPLLQGKGRPRYSFRSSSWARGKFGLPGKRAQSVDDYFMEIISGTTAASWQRSPATHGAWRPLNLRTGKPPVNIAYISELCRPLFASSFHFPVNGWHDAGTATLRGSRVRRVQMQADAGGGERQTFTIFIDLRTLYWVRYQRAVNRPRGVESFDFSRFDAPVRITPPRA